jgi:hypothetical protein
MTSGFGHVCIHFTHLNTFQVTDDLYLFSLRRICSHIRTYTSIIASRSRQTRLLPFLYTYQYLSALTRNGERASPMLSYSGSIEESAGVVKKHYINEIGV